MRLKERGMPIEVVRAADLAAPADTYIGKQIFETSIQQNTPSSEVHICKKSSKPLDFKDFV